MLVGKKIYKNNRAFLIVETKGDKLFIVSYEDLLRATKNIITNGSSNFQGAARHLLLRRKLIELVDPLCEPSSMEDLMTTELFDEEGEEILFVFEALIELGEVRVLVHQMIPAWFSELLEAKLSLYMKNSNRTLEDSLCLTILKRGLQPIPETAHNCVQIDVTQSPFGDHFVPKPLVLGNTWYAVKITDWSVNNKNGFENIDPSALSPEELNAFYHQFDDECDIVHSENTSVPPDRWGECLFERHLPS